ncbi:hypothetical protein [Metabacillus sediminilitoris]|uniref:Uncharacterized protein n=1 Tax=Metabacillus sediminilitoris TaxID=2567941 RepID=A0A4S4BVD3_9BACI|nr:hypothetical protein [Metabacillus sediminilitoris]QGQ44697.1 hypothetical protein GMB29_05090 [Metabacillus sediminilitoris]THF78954.1 hypothetical protein E6W99_14640 [Metabacillus sediminilitoris]
MKATPYAWATIFLDHESTEKEHVESQENATEYFSSETVTLIVQLIEKLVDLTITDSNRAAQEIHHLLKQVDTL